jgi:hypothetical protein
MGMPKPAGLVRDTPAPLRLGLWRDGWLFVALLRAGTASGSLVKDPRGQHQHGQVGSTVEAGAMKFPLPADTMPRVHLAPWEQDKIERLASAFIHETVEQYMERLSSPEPPSDPGGLPFARRRSRAGSSSAMRVDKKRWKPIKTRDSMTVFQDRQAGETVRQKASFRDLLESPAALRKTHVVMGLGHCDGYMEDAVYGSIAPSVELMMIKTAYCGDGVVDCAMLCPIVLPTREDPLCELQIKWCVNGSAPLLVQSLVRHRDFVYIEASGVIMHESGERIGYNFLHSLELEGVPNLNDLGLVRANLSICSLFRQRPDSAGVELFLQGFCDPMGGMHPSVAILTTAEALLSYTAVVQCGRMKKLTWVLKKNAEIVYALEYEICCVCQRGLAGASLHPKKRCRICKGRMCRKCRVPKKLSFVMLDTRELRQYKLSFCSTCVTAAVHSHTLAIAADELASDNPMVAYEMDQESITSMSSFRSSATSYLRGHFFTED